MTSYVQIAKFAICPTSSACEGAAAPSPSNPRLLSTEPRPSMSDTGTTSPVRHGTRIPRWNPARLPLVARAGKAAVRFRRLSSFCGRNMTGIRSASGARIWRSVSGARLQPLDEIKDLFRRTHVLHFRENRHERVGVCLRPRGLRLAACASRRSFFALASIARAFSVASSNLFVAISDTSFNQINLAHSVANICESGIVSIQFESFRIGLAPATPAPSASGE